MSHYIPPFHEHDLDPVEGRTNLVQEGPTFAEVTASVAAPIEHPNKAWWIFFMVSLTMLGAFGISIAYLFWEGIGIWGNNIPVGWGWPIVNFVFWVGIGHAGTLISAVLFLFRQKWRTAINRASEAMTIFAVICALSFPTIHVGRVWVIYWPLPIPNQMDMWPNFRSPLLWDVFAVSTYFTVSLLFWYVGLIPDIATMRDRSKTYIRKLVYGIFALGWRGSHRHWVNYEAAYLLLAAMATPLVLSVHSIVSFDFAVSQLPGWHTTIFPPYFVAGAIFSGFGMVLTLMIPIRKWFHLEYIITVKHLENMAKIILLTGSLVGYSYGMEFFIAWYSGNPYESFAFVNRAFGDYSWAYWIMISCNVITPQFIWSKKIRRSATALFILSIFVNIGMWFERFVIVATSLHHDFLPSSWDYFSPTLWDISTLVGSFGLFFTLFCLFLRYLPTIALSEIKGVMPQANPHYKPPTDGKRSSVSKSATGVVESREDIPLKKDQDSGRASAADASVSSAKVVIADSSAAIVAEAPDKGGGGGDPPDSSKLEAKADAPVKPSEASADDVGPTKPDIVPGALAGADAKKAEAPKTEAKAAEPKAEAKADEAKAEAPKAEAKADEAKAEAPKTEAKAEAPKAEAPKTEAKAEAPKAEAPKAEAPKAEAPKAEDKKVEDKKDEPKADAPKVEPPAAKPGGFTFAAPDPAKKDEPKADAPKVEAKPAEAKPAVKGWTMMLEDDGDDDGEVKPPAPKASDKADADAGDDGKDDA